MKATRFDVDDFWSKVDKTGDCWLWTGLKGRGGYGRYSRSGEYVHRITYTLIVGPIPEGKSLDHLCRSRSCVNPAHLEPVTHRENVLRGEGPTAVNARKSHYIHGHPFDEENTIVRPGGRRGCRACLRVQSRAHRKRLAAQQEGDHACPECGLKFSKPRGLVTHRVRVHTEREVAS